jgi:hypothetical protein
LDISPDLPLSMTSPSVSFVHSMSRVLWSSISFLPYSPLYISYPYLTPLDSLGPFLILSPAVPPINQNSSYRGYQNEGNKLWVAKGKRKRSWRNAGKGQKVKGGHLIGGWRINYSFPRIITKV